jgi:glycosyltransferase involved in cell wall biosynthesis
MKLTWYSNAPWCGTGYGGQTALFVPRILADGHEVSIAANFGLSGTPVDWNGISVIGQGYDAFSNDVAPAHHARWVGEGKGWMLTLFDAWTLRMDLPNVASWIPVDHLTVPPEVAAWARAHYTIAMSRFGQQALGTVGVEARYVPHAVDTTVFRPGALLASAGAPWRQAVKLPTDAFVVGIVGANKGFPARKGFGEMFSAMALFMERHSDVLLYVHSDMVGFNGVDLDSLAASVGLPRDRVHYVDQFAQRASLISAGDMAGIYAGLDVLLNTSYGEGFGVPIIEAQACGVPVIVTDATAMPELVGVGWKVPGQPWWNAPQRAWWCIPNVGATLAALEEAYTSKAGLDAPERARAFAMQYDVDSVYDTYWRPVLAELAAELGDPKPVNTAIRPKRKGGRK